MAVVSSDENSVGGHDDHKGGRDWAMMRCSAVATAHAVTMAVTGPADTRPTPPAAMAVEMQRRLTRLTGLL